MTDPVSSVASLPTSTPPRTSISSLGPDAFMQLLVAQLKYQDPMSPTDNAQSLAQMATFTQVEKLDALVEAQGQAAAWQQRLSAEGMVGKQVTGTGTDGEVAGLVTGVSYTTTGPVLELQGGATLRIADITRVTAAGTPAAS